MAIKKTIAVAPVKAISDETYYCSMQISEPCKNKKGILNDKDFYMTTNLELFRNKKVPFCKDCMKAYIYSEEGNISLDKFKKILMLIDYPFYEIEFESAIKGKNETIGTYMKNIQLNHKGATWGSGDRDYEKTIINNEIVEDIDFTVSAEIIKFWGKNYTKDEYLFLQEYYHDLIRMYDHSLPVQVNNYRNMAKTQLQANKCLNDGDMGGYDKTIKILSMLSGDSNIKPVQENSTEKITKGGFDVFIKHIEDDEPILIWDKDLKFADKIKYYLSIFFFGNLARAININNPFKEEFEKEMKEYTVETSVAEEDLESQVDFLEGK